MALENPITIQQILLCFVLAVGTCVVFRFIFASKRDLWFARTKSSIINQRGLVGQYISLGYPVTFPGLLVALLQVAIICVEIFLIIHFNLSF